MSPCWLISSALSVGLSVRDAMALESSLGLVLGDLRVALRLLAAAAVSWVPLPVLKSVSVSTPLLQLPL